MRPFADPQAEAKAQLFPEVYSELARIAARQLLRERYDHTLPQIPDLVSEGISN